MKYLVLVILVSTCLNLKSQDIRDSFTGIYSTKKDYYFNGHFSQSLQIPLYVLKDTTESHLITIIDSSQGSLAVWRRTMRLNELDSTFEDTLYPIPYHGKFYSTDSIYVYRWGMTTSNNWAEYFGSKSFPSSVEFIDQVKFHCYPNPATDNLYLSPRFNGDAELYTINGELIYSLKIEKDRPVNIEKLPQGAYLIILIDRNRTLIKFVK